MTTISQYQAPKNLLDNKIIAITGAGDGIGRIVAKTYAQYGATVILMGKTIAKLEGIYDEIVTAGFPEPAIIPIDLELAQAQHYEEVCTAIEETFGRLDGLVHNAAQLGQRTSIANYNPAVWQTLIQVNVNAPFLLSKHCLPLLQKSEAASILFTGSSVGLRGRAYWGAYAVSKGAQENLMQVLADELENTSNIRVNSFNPGATRTQMRASAYPAEDPTTVKPIEALLPYYLYLMGDDSIQENGQAFEFQSTVK